MAKLLEQARANLTFILVCGLIIAGLALAARIAERFLPAKRKVTAARRVTIVSICAALATVLHILDFPLPFLAPEFYKLDFSELPALVASFVVSPVAGVAVCLVKNLINLFFTTTGGAGELCNFLMGVTMVLPAGLFYRYRKTRGGAIIACLLGSSVMAGVSLLINYYISYPVYAQVFAPMDVILGAYQSLNPNVNDLWDALIWFNMPFTFVKGIVVSAITFVIYKPLSNALKKLW